MAEYVIIAAFRLQKWLRSLLLIIKNLIRKRTEILKRFIDP